MIENGRLHLTREQSLQTNDMENAACRTNSEGIVIELLKALYQLYLSVIPMWNPSCAYNLVIFGRGNWKYMLAIMVHARFY